MKVSSILNDVLGPVMRGPSSSHNAAAYQIACCVRDLLGETPVCARFTFDAGSSFAEVFRAHGSDLSFACGVLGLPVDTADFAQALDLAKRSGVDISFAVTHLPGADHPNTVEIYMAGAQRRHLSVRAKSTGGGAFAVTQIEEWPVHISSDAYDVLVVCADHRITQVCALLTSDGEILGPADIQTRAAETLIHVRRGSELAECARREIESMSGVREVWLAPPAFFVKRGLPLFSSAQGMIHFAERLHISLGAAALAYEAALLGVSEDDIVGEILRRFEIMRQAVHLGLSGQSLSLQLLRPSAQAIWQAEANGRLPTGGTLTRAAARALAVMHVTASHGLVCAAPTGGSAGTLPGVIVTLAEEKCLSPQQTALALLAASAVGLIVDTRATFAAELAGCQAEIGVAGAMSAAAVVEVAGGTAAQAADAGAIALQNTMGSVCDLVQGAVEIPCHSRNAAAAAAAFVCADLVLGGYANPIPLDDTIDAMMDVGRLMPCELKCTGRGGLSMAPAALAIEPGSPNGRRPSHAGR